MTRPSLLMFTGMLLVMSGCTCGGEPAVRCVDEDADGVCISAGDCDDSDATRFPSATESCDGKDNDCDGEVDEGCGCNVAEPPRACGVAGSACTQACLPGGKLGPCQPPTGAVNTSSDVAHCGQCGNACPTPKNALASCSKGICGRGPCAKGSFDFDGPVTFGCEMSCSGKVCTDPSGNTVTVTGELLPESGAVFQALASGSSYGATVQTSSRYTNIGILGESTPPLAQGATIQTNSKYKNISGFSSSQLP